MLTAFNLDIFESAKNYADTLIVLPDIDENTRYTALLIKGRIELQQKNYDNAISFFEPVISSANIDLASEALYQQAYAIYQQNKLKEAEIAANRAIQKTSVNAYWNIKSYLLMADIFIKQKDYFNAKATLQSIEKNSKNEDLKKSR